MTHILISLLVYSSFFLGNSFAQTAPTDKVPEAEARRLLYMIYDSSNSMWGELSDKSHKYETGRTAMNSVLGLKLGDQDLAFRAYGHHNKTDCCDAELLVPASPTAVATPAIQEAITNIRPTGKTPITFSLREALKAMWMGHPLAGFVK